MLPPVCPACLVHAGCHTAAMTTPESDDDDSRRDPWERVGAGIGVVLIAAVAIVAMGLLLVIVYGVVMMGLFVIREWDTASAGLWRLVSNNIVGLGGWAAAGVAVFSVRVLARTNAARAREAVNNDFRDFMQWALENVNQEDDKASQFFAYSVIQQFAENPPKNLDDKNRYLSEKVYHDVTKLVGSNAHSDAQDPHGNKVDMDSESRHTGSTAEEEEGDR